MSFADAYFSRCDAFHSFIKWKAGSESFIVTNATGEAPFLEKEDILDLHVPLDGPPCSWTYIYASASGQAMLHATFSKEYHHIDPSLSGPIVLRVTSRIASYMPLTLHQAGDGNHFGGYWVNTARIEATNQLEDRDKVYLVPGTQIDVILHGGPERWDKDVEFVDRVEIFDEEHAHDNGVDVHLISSSHGSLYRLLCQTLGTYVSFCAVSWIALNEFQLKSIYCYLFLTNMVYQSRVMICCFLWFLPIQRLVFKRGNLVGDDHPLPTLVEASLSLACSLPSSIVVIVDEPGKCCLYWVDVKYDI